MAIVKTNYLKHEDNYYEIIPPVPTESDRGGIVASTKTSTDTVEAKLGDDGKLYVPDVNAAISAHNTNTSAHTDIQERLNELESNPYTLPQATGSTLGGVTIGDNIQVSNGKISVKNSNTSQPGVVQLTDSASSTSTTTAATANSVKKAYDLANTAKTNAANAQTAADEAKASAVTAQTTAESGVSKANAAQSAVDALNDEVTAHTGNSDVHFTAAERTKLSGIEAGAQKNTITGIKGSSESSYRTGNVNITKANIGLGNVNNTADSAKPVSTAQQTAIDSALAEAKSHTDTKISGHNHDTKYDTKGAADAALDEAKDYTDTKVANLASTTVVDNKISSHNVSTSSHNDIRGLITALTTKVNNFLDVDDTTTDQLSEVLTLINNNKGTLDSLTSGKVNVSDIVDNITTSSSTKVLSAKQGVALKGLIDTLQTALDALESEFDGHGHAIADVSGLQTALDGKAAKSHGTHVSYSTTAPVMDGKASVGSASTVARSDHKHPTDTSRASQVDLDALEAIVDGKANNAHSHAIPDITNLQTILDAKQSIITGGASTITGSNLTANRALISNGSGKVSVSAVTSTELGYLDGVTSSVQTQLDSKSSASHTHNYAGSSSAGGAATSANKVNSSLTVKLNSGTTEGTNQFTFNGSSAKSVNITPSSIGAATSSHNHDDRYYTESEVDTKLSGKANTSHGNHVPATQTASNKVFLRNDNTWATVTPANIGAAASSHTHKVANISDLTATATELNYMDGVTSNVQAQLDGKASSSHKHTVSQISDLTATAAELNKLDGVTATTTELNYVDGVTSNIQTQLNSKITNNPFNGSGTDGEKGYIAFAQLKITQNHTNRPIEFELICRSRQTPCYVSIVFSNSGTTDPSIESLKYCGTDYGIFAVKSTTSTWLLYHTKTEAWDNVTIARIQAASQGITITYPGSFITTKPTSGVTNASLGGSVSFANSATSATKATQDASGNTITSTYATKSELNTAKSNLQASIDAKQATITGGASTITSSNLTANRALVSNGSGKVAVSAVTSTELGYLDGVTSNIQTQINSLNSNKADMLKMTIFTPCIGGKTSYYCEASYKYGITPVSNTITMNELFSSLVPGDVSLHPIESGIYRFEIVLCESGVTMSTNGYTVLYLTSNSSAEAVYSKSYGPGSICYRHIFCAYLNAGTSYALHYQRYYSSCTVWGDGSIASAVITKIRN